MKGKPCKVKLSCAWEEHDGRKRKALSALSPHQEFPFLNAKRKQSAPQAQEPKHLQHQTPSSPSSSSPVACVSTAKEKGHWLILAKFWDCLHRKSRASGCPLQNCFFQEENLEHAIIEDISCFLYNSYWLLKATKEDFSFSVTKISELPNTTSEQTLDFLKE